MAYQKIESHDEYLKVVEQYKDYEAGTYQWMSIKEKMDFFDGIHTDNVPLVDGDGDDMETADDYAAICDEFMQHPEMFALADIRLFVEMLDDWCYQPSFMDTILEIIHNIVVFYGLNGVIFLLTHFKDVPERARQYGLIGSLRRLMNDEVTYPLLKKALKQIDPSARELVQLILKGEDAPKTPEREGEIRHLYKLDECGSEKVLKKKEELERILFRSSR